MNYISGIKVDGSPTGNMDCDSSFQEKQDQMPHLPFTCTGNPGRKIQYTYHIGPGRFNHITPFYLYFVWDCNLQGTNNEEHFSPLLN